MLKQKASNANDSSNALGYQPALDGLRTIAVILVMLLHAHFQLGKYGFIGVDLFFTLSGFLITTLLLEEHSVSGRISIPRFLLRRLFRLFPALLLVLFFVFIYALLTNDITKKTALYYEVWSSFFYINNISWLWGWGTESILLGHTWSLAVEEQFYFVWPLILFLFLRFLMVRQLIVILSLFIVASYVFRYNYNSAAYSSLIREPVFIGCLLALLRWRYGYPVKISGVLLSFTLVLFVCFGLFSFSVIDDWFASYTGRNSIGFISALLILGILTNPLNHGTKLLGSSFFAGLGKISYSLYLWHLPVFRLFYWHSELAESLSFFLKFIITFVLAYLSWYFIETPVIQRGRKFLSTHI